MFSHNLVLSSPAGRYYPCPHEGSQDLYVLIQQKGFFNENVTSKFITLLKIIQFLFQLDADCRGTCCILNNPL